MTNRVSMATAVCACFLLSAVPGVAFVPPPTVPNIIDILENEMFKEFLFALKLTGLDTDLLEKPGPFTVFAPTDPAFVTAFGPWGVSNVSIVVLKDLMLYHIYNGSLPTSAIKNGEEITMMNGATAVLNITKSGIAGVPGRITVDDIYFTNTDYHGSNGYIQWIDQVLKPEDFPGNLPGTIPAELSTCGDYSCGGVLADSLEALQLTHLTSVRMLDGVLDGPGPFTMFAPTDTAFKAAGIDSPIVSYDTPAKLAVLKDLMLYHVYNGSLPMSAIKNGEAITMMNGAVAQLTVTNDTASGIVVKINNATLPNADHMDGIRCSNGIIQLIDQVLQPPATPSPPAPTPSPPVPAPTKDSSHTALIVGLAVGGAFVVGALVAFFFFRRRRSFGFRSVV